MKKNKILSMLLLGFLLFLGPIVLAQHALVDNRIPIDLLDTNGNGLVVLSEPGHYFLRDTLLVTGDNNDGIVINSDNVTVDLNGFAVISGSDDTDDGIYVLGNQQNITIKNGTVAGFGGDGINAFAADQSTFCNLTVKDNGADGLVTDFGCLVVNCIATDNGEDGLQVDDESIIRDCTAAFNGDNGIETSEGCMVYHCTSYGNAMDGIEAAAACHVRSCTVYDNARFGIDIALGTLCLHNTAYRNGWTGIDAQSNALVLYNICNDNGTCIVSGTCGTGTNGQGSTTYQGTGIHISANAIARNNQCSGNYFGIVSSSTDATIIGNHVQNNRHAGILVINLGSLYIKNSAEGNGFEQAPGVSSSYPMGDIVFGTGDFDNSSVGPIIDVSGGGDISTISGATHPFANFVY